jgi:hypothetical protein
MGEISKYLEGSNVKINYKMPHEREIPKKKYYVTMTDKFMSGWGMAEGKTNKYVIGCNTYQQAETIVRNARKRSEMKHINIVVGRKPYFNPRRFIVSYQDYKELGAIWKKQS